MKNEITSLMQELVEQQRSKLLTCARRIVPTATSDDILQPNDFPELENHPHFRYEEGILDGLQVAQAALLRAEKER
jgi:hypothetical protein